MTNNIELALAYVEETKRRLRTALRLIGIEPPKVYDVGPVLMQNRGKILNFFREKIPELVAISRWLRREREPSMYGDEELGIPPTKLYTEPYARKACESAIMVLTEVDKLFNHVLRGEDRM
ncbi:MAG: HEPN domain-containing protein [Crenarchaeota archaeon]|nr:HEPN domain-containing protein [Thermoproteota archaeon]